MADAPPKTISGGGGGGGGASLTGVVVVAAVRVLCLVLLSTGKEITNEGDLVDQSNSSISPSVEKPVTTTFGNRRRTLRWRIGSSDILTASTSYNDYKEPWSSTVPLMASGFDSNSTPEPRDVHQQSWTLHPKSEIAIDNILKTSTTSDAKSIGQPLEETKKMNTRNDTAEGVSSVLESFQARTDAVSISSSVMASDAFRFDYSQNREQKLFGDASDYGNEENEDYEEEEEEEDEDYNSNEDERDYYNEDYPYEEEPNENGRLRDPAEYEGKAYRDSVSEASRRYFREGNLRLPINYSDPGNREIRRLVIGGKPNQIDMSLLVIYAWLGLVVIMIAITVVIFKYKQQLSARCLKLTSNCRKVRQVIGIEEGNNLLGHPLV